MLRGYFRFNNKSCFFQGYTELLTQKNWHNWSVLMEDVCINNKLLSKETLLVMPFHYFCATIITVWGCRLGNENAEHWGVKGNVGIPRRG